MIRRWLRAPRPIVWAALAVLALGSLAGATVRDITRVHAQYAERNAACARVAAEEAARTVTLRPIYLAVDMAVDKCAALARISPRLVDVAITTTPEGGPR